VAKELNLDWDAVKELDKLVHGSSAGARRHAGAQGDWHDEISIRKGHTYRIVVSDLLRRRPIWFGGTDRSEASMAAFYDWLGPKKSEGIRLAVMDMWKPSRKVTAERAPKAAVLIPHHAALGRDTR
jgi:transposase